MANPRQPIDSTREDISKNRLDDSMKQEAGSFELDDENLESSDELEDEEDLDY